MLGSCGHTTRLTCNCKVSSKTSYLSQHKTFWWDLNSKFGHYYSDYNQYARFLFDNILKLVMAKVGMKLERNI